MPGEGKEKSHAMEVRHMPNRHMAGREGSFRKKKGNPKIRKAYLHSGPNPKERERKENGRVVPF